MSSRARRNYRFVFLVLAPVMALFIYLRVIPTGQTLVMSLFDWQSGRPGPGVRRPRSFPYIAVVAMARPRPFVRRQTEGLPRK